MKGLILDTSGESALIALSEQGLLSHSRILPSVHTSSLLATHIQTLLHEASCPIRHVNYIGIGIGPGSFLGTRIGVTIGKSLAYGLQIPLVSFCSLQAYAPEGPMDFAALSDAKSKGCYLLQGVKNRHNVLYDSTPSLYSAEELYDLHQVRPLRYVSPNITPLLKKLPFLVDLLTEVPPALSYLCQLCNEKIAVSPTHALDPLPIHYLRLS